MNWHVLHDASTGEARVICTTEELPPLEQIAAEGLAVFDAPPGIDPRQRLWDAAARNLGSEPLQPRSVDPSDLIAAFSQDEWAALKASTHPRVAQYYDQITSRITPINVASPRVEQAFSMLVAIGLLTRERADAITAALKAGEI